MQHVTPDMKVAYFINEAPKTVDIFLSYRCPDMRRGLFSVMPRLMSVCNAARIYRLPLDALLADLENARNPN